MVECSWSSFWRWFERKGRLWVSSRVCACDWVFIILERTCARLFVSLMFTEGGSWSTSHACRTSQRRGLHFHRGLSPCSNSCAVSSHQVTCSDLHLRGWGWGGCCLRPACSAHAFFHMIGIDWRLAVFQANRKCPQK